MIIVILYLLITREIRRSQTKILVHEEKDTGKLSFKRKQQQNQLNVRFAKKVALIIFCYMICFMPGLLAIVTTVADSNGDIVKSVTYHHISLFTLFMSLFNSCLNPIIYATMKHNEFNTSLQKTLKRLRFSSTKLKTKFIREKSKDIEGLSLASTVYNGYVSITSPETQLSSCQELQSKQKQKQ